MVFERDIIALVISFLSYASLESFPIHRLKFLFGIWRLMRLFTVSTCTRAKFRISPSLTMNATLRLLVAVMIISSFYGMLRLVNPSAVHLPPPKQHPLSAFSITQMISS